MRDPISCGTIWTCEVWPPVGKFSGLAVDFLLWCSRGRGGTALLRRALGFPLLVLLSRLDQVLICVGPFRLLPAFLRLSSLYRSLPDTHWLRNVGGRRPLHGGGLRSVAAWCPYIQVLYGLLMTYLDMGLTLSPLGWGVTWAFGTVGPGLSLYAVVAAHVLVGAGRALVSGGYLRLVLGEVVMRDF